MIDDKIRDELVERAKKGDHSVLRSKEFKSLADQIKTIDSDKRPAFGKELNRLRKELENLLANNKQKTINEKPIDITAPWDVNTVATDRPQPFRADEGSTHPLMADCRELIDIFARMGFSSIESRQLDDDWNMFTSLNFPEGHPARDDWDTFNIEETDKDGKPLIAPAHTSTMQNRVLSANKELLKEGKPIAYVIPGRVFRNEDVDATHEHTLDQLEGLYVDKGVHAGMLIATLKTFLQEYYGKKLDVRTQPFYFPFTEPSFELSMSCPFCDKKGCNVCKNSGWIEILGCGMIHPNVLSMAGIDSEIYTGFAWGVGTMRLTMMKHGIEDIRHFNSANLKFLRQFR
ncbi:MAG: phenylalanine--tRNA ligase subunit alpha [Candidatus Saccharimonadales bacterium]